MNNFAIRLSWVVLTPINYVTPICYVYIVLINILLYKDNYKLPKVNDLFKCDYYYYVIIITISITPRAPVQLIFDLH